MATEMIAIVLGGYAFAAGLGILIHPKKVEGLLEGLKSTPALTFFIGVFVYFLCAILLVLHHGWDGWLQIVITLTLWGGVVEGLVFLIWPNAVIALASPFWVAGVARIWGLLAMVLGSALIVAGMNEAGVISL